MDDKSHISDGITEIFRHRESFIVIALTGRTGSGCTTVAKLLATKKFTDLNFPEIPSPLKNHEDRKNRIVKNWIKEHWHPFQIIQVSQIIFLLALQKSIEDFIEFIEKFSTKPDIKESLRNKLQKDYHLHFKSHEVIENLKSATSEDISLACNYFRDDLPRIFAAFKEIISSDTNNLYTEIFQKFGDNIRRSGDPLLSEPNGSNSKNLLTLPRVIEKIIKLYRWRDHTEPKKHNNYFVIDALRHPFEIRFLRERISSFYTIAVTTHDKSRIDRLVKLGYRKKEIDSLSEKEYPLEAKDKLSGYAAFISQNVQLCLEISDIYIRNEQVKNTDSFKELSKDICRYVALMQHPGLVTPTSIERCMQVAFSAKLNSGCISRQVGAVITDEDYSIKAIGWNDAPRGQVPCLLRNTSHVLKKRDSDAYSDYEKENKEFQQFLGDSPLGKEQEYIDGRNNTFCFKSVYNKMEGEKNQVHTRSLHAEENAFLQISRYGGQGIVGGCLFSTASPCELCAKKAFQLGIKNIYYIDPYPGISRQHVLTASKKENNPIVSLFTGAIGHAYHELYQPVMPYKDELDCLVPE